MQEIDRKKRKRRKKGERVEEILLKTFKNDT
jgi:hypothetical protein